jgi:hypothetical protein
MVNSHKAYLKNPDLLSRYVRRRAERAAEHAVKFVTGSNTLKEAFSKVGWTMDEKITTARGAYLLQKWGVPVSRATEFAIDCNLGPNVTTAKIRSYSKGQTSKWSINVSADGKVAELELNEVLSRAAKESKNAGEPPAMVEVKVAFDGAQITTNRKNLQIATVSFPEQGSIGEAMSPENAQVFWVMEGKENEEAYREGLKTLAPQISSLLGKKEFECDGVKVNVVVRIVLDMKSLTMFLGMCQVYNSNSKCGCVYCHCPRGQMGSGKAYTRRTTDEVNKFSNMAKEKGPLNPKENLGYSHQSLFGLPPGQILLLLFPPDLLHICLNGPRKLLEELLSVIAINEKDVTNQVIAFLRDRCGVYVSDSVIDGKAEKRDILTRVITALWRRDNWLKLLAHSSELMVAVSQAQQFIQKPDEFQQVCTLWKGVVDLFSVMIADPNDAEALKDLNVQYTHEAYDVMACEVRGLMNKLYGPKAFTTYWHIILDHVGELIEAGHNFPRYANFDIEGKHLVLKKATKGVTGNKRMAQIALEKDITGRSAKQETKKRNLKRERDEKARDKLVLAGQKKRGRKLNPNKKAPLHTLKPTSR